MRALFGLAGFLVVLAATHLNVMHAGGYLADSAPLIGAVAFFVLVGMSAVGYAVEAGKWIPAVTIFICVVAGEGYWLGVNADREMSARAREEAPFAEARRQYGLVEKRVDDAKSAKAAADTRAAEALAQKDCKKFCSEHLAADQEGADKELREAREVLSRTVKPQTSTGVADEIGMSPRRWDLLMAVLRSLGVLGGSLLVGLALHKPSKSDAKIARVDAQLPKTADVASFALKALVSAPGASVESKRLFPVYCAHAAKNGLSALPRELFELELATLWKEAGLEVQPVRNGIKVLGVKLAA